MINHKNNPERSRKWVAFVLLSVLVFLIYSNTFQASWHFDDFPNIVLNPYLKISDLKAETLYNTFFASRKDGFYQQTKLYRPLACLSLALNWYAGQQDVSGYHVVNLLIHIVTTIFLFLTVLLLFRSPNLRSKFEGSQYFIALLTAVLWAVNPIQTQAVTYIVQRMASMAAMFYVMGLYFYLKGRLQPVAWKSTVCFAGCLLSYGLALASKENSVTLPVAWVLLEALFFQDLTDSRTRRRIYWITAGAAIGIAVVGLIFFLKGDFSVISKTYSDRSFTPLQRLMTQPRVLIFYLSLIFYPIPTRLSIEHDLVLSTSLIDPLTTLPSILLIFALIGLGLFQMHRRPLLSLAILFFFLTHVIESSIIGLELIFEHRNYLPSLFVFLPVATGIKWLLDHYRDHRRAMYRVIVSFVTVIILGFGIGTFVRNIAWSTEKTLWEDAMQKAPNSVRPYHNLAWGYYWKSGQYDKAAELYEKSLGFSGHANISQARIINNIANIHFIKGDIRKAGQMFHEAYRRYPQYALFQLNLAKVKVKTGEWQAALGLLNKILDKAPEHRPALSLKGQVMFRQHRYARGVECFLKLLAQKPDDPIALLQAGIGLRLTGDLQRAKWHFNSAHQTDPQNISPLLWLLETNLKLEDELAADRLEDKLLARFP